MTDAMTFFHRKKPWSPYKDLILEYYLDPYLQKIKILRKPILVVDCFAGAGRFEDGRPGSPVIIADRLQTLAEKGFPVQALFVEEKRSLYESLKSCMGKYTFPIHTRPGNFHDHIEEIASLAQGKSVFVYLDPFAPSQLHFADMQYVYDKLREGQSVETLINFMSWGFLRGTLGVRQSVTEGAELLTAHPYVRDFDSIAGGTYWQGIAFNDSLSVAKRTEHLADRYRRELHRWFKFTLTYPIQHRYATRYPKYHLVFGSRSPDAIDLMNRAMVKARREFIANEFIRGHLFPNQPQKEVFDIQQVKKTVVDVSAKMGKTTWRHLRVSATIMHPGLYTDSEFNRGIKEAIQNRELDSDCSGKRIEENAKIWPHEHD